MITGKPGTAATNTKLIELHNPSTYGEVIEYEVNVDKGNTLLGGGIGVWDDARFADEIVKIDNIDYLDLHFYPQKDKYFQNVLDYADLARSHDKKVYLTESWLYKFSEEEINQGGAIAIEAFRRDVFDFWIPLDKRHHDVMVKLAKYKQFDFISFFWTRYYYAYLPHNDQTKDLPAATLFKMTDQKAVNNWLNANFTETGLNYRDLVDN